MSPIRDEIFEISDFHEFLLARFKVGKGGVAGQLGDDVSIRMEKYKIIVTSKEAFAKKYLKFLTGKFLKKNELRDYFRIVASAKNTFELRYFNAEEEN